MPPPVVIAAPRRGWVYLLISSRRRDRLVAVGRLFDDLPAIVFFVRYRGGRYLKKAVNSNARRRCGFNDKARCWAKRPSDLFPAALAARYERQDQRGC